MFLVTKYGKELDKNDYTWDEKNKVFSANRSHLVLDFSNYYGVTFTTGSHCIFKTGPACTFNTDYDCAFYTGCNCIFNTDSYCIFYTGSGCTFKTGDDCVFRAGEDCIFETGKNCFVTRYDINGVTEIPANKKIKLNRHQIAGYTEIKEEIKETNCNGKVVVIDGKKYTLQLKGE